MSRAQTNYDWNASESRDTGCSHQFVGERTGAFVVCTDFCSADWDVGDTGVEIHLRSTCGRIDERRKIDESPPEPGRWLDVVFDHLPTHLLYSLDFVTKNGTRHAIFADTKYFEINGIGDRLREKQISPITHVESESSD